MSSVKTPGMILVSTLSMEAQIVNVAHLAFCHLRQARPYISAPDLAVVILAAVTTRLDFYNSLYIGLGTTSSVTPPQKGFTICRSASAQGQWPKRKLPSARARWNALPIEIRALRELN